MIYMNKLINIGYKLGYYQQENNGRIREAVITIELLDGSKKVDNRMHEIYDFMKTDVLKLKIFMILMAKLSPMRSYHAYQNCQPKYPKMKSSVLKTAIFIK